MRVYCYGKNGICERETCDKSCEHHDGTGSRYVKRQTEYERIRAMSQNDLGRFLCSLMNSEDCYNRCPAREYCHHGHNGMNEYLSQPVEEDE